MADIKKFAEELVNLTVKSKNKTNNLIIRNHGRYQEICGRVSKPHS